MVSRRELVGVISDTHGHFDPSIPVWFEGVSHILHAGDIGSREAYDQLLSIAPVTAVSGNVDIGQWFSSFKSQQLVELFEVRIWLVHILGNPHRLSVTMEKEIIRIQPQVVVFGHSHQPFIERLGSVLFFNPGSAGPKRFHLPRCLGFLEIESGRVEAKITDL
jgi:putative phosphoesterase